MNGSRDPQAGPSRPGRSASQTLGSSPEFGEFASVSPSRPVGSDNASHAPNLSFGQSSQLAEGDLLGSFDGLGARQSSPEKTGGYDLLRDIDWIDSSTTTTTNTTGSAPIHITLPPRPDEISPDYNPRSPRSSRRRLSHRLSSTGPGSPPRVSDIGRDIVFHPSSDTSPQRHGPPLPSNHRRLPSGVSQDDSSPTLQNTPPSPAQSRLFNTLATTTKLASKWKSALDHPNILHRQTSRDKSPSSESLPPTALPIEITHQTPFATADQVAGSYIAPSGAPGFDKNAQNGSQRPKGEDEDWAGTILTGRRETTDPVLLGPYADQLRKHLPPRKRLSGTWTLLFSMDQHGASLASLYRLVEKYALAHRGCGNFLVVRDGRGNRFGAFINESIMKREGSYYGGGECFLFKIVESTKEVRTFPWTGKNQYFALCEGGFVSFGGGSGAYGLLLDSSFSRNSSATCPTFDNEVLCTSEAIISERAVPFDCIGLEVWGT